MAKKFRSLKAKGVRLEKDVAKRIEEVLGDHGAKATRTPMSGAIERFKGDIFTNLPISIECKNKERLNFREAWNQAKRDSGQKIPILMTSKNHDPEILCMLELEDLLTLMDYALQGGWVDL